MLLYTWSGPHPAFANSTCRSVDPELHSHSTLCPNVLLLTVLGFCGGTSGPEQLSSGCPRPECIRGRCSLLLLPRMPPDSCLRESPRSTFLCTRGRCSLLLPPRMPPDSVHFAPPTANSYLVSHLAVQETPHGRRALPPQPPALLLSAAQLESKVPINARRSHSGIKT